MLVLIVAEQNTIISVAHSRCHSFNLVQLANQFVKIYVEDKRNDAAALGYAPVRRIDLVVKHCVLHSDDLLAIIVIVFLKSLRQYFKKFRP